MSDATIHVSEHVSDDAATVAALNRLREATADATCDRTPSPVNAPLLEELQGIIEGRFVDPHANRLAIIRGREAFRQAQLDAMLMRNAVAGAERKFFDGHGLHPLVRRD